MSSQIESLIDEKGLIVGITGILDANTAPNLKEEILSKISEENKVILFDLSNLNYLSSAVIKGGLVSGSYGRLGKKGTSVDSTRMS